MTWKKELVFEIQVPLHSQVGSSCLVRLPACLLRWFWMCCAAFGYRRCNREREKVSSESSTSSYAAKVWMWNSSAWPKWRMSWEMLTFSFIASERIHWIKTELNGLWKQKCSALHGGVLIEVVVGELKASLILKSEAELLLGKKVKPSPELWDRNFICDFAFRFDS